MYIAPFTCTLCAVVKAGWPEKTPAILVCVGGSGGLLKVPRGNSQLWLFLDQPVCKCGWIKAARSTEHEARNLPLLRHAIDRFWRLPKHLGYFFHRKYTGERVESGQDVKWGIKWGITPRRDESIFQRRISVRRLGFG